MNGQQTQTPLPPRPSTFTVPISYCTGQGTPEPFITRPYLSTQYPQQQQKIPLQELTFIPTHFPVISDID